MQHLKIIPFGAQYYRAPTPLSKDWVQDLTNFRNQGFNTIKIWAQWGWNMPEENVFDFGDLDKLMSLCEELDIKVVINIIYDVAPHWFYKKYPDSLMVSADGRPLQPQATAWRQIGGAPGPCLHHPKGIKSRLRFTEAVVKRYANHPALLCWDLWNEPELTCGIRRATKQSDMVCYCKESVRQFRLWLKKRYKTIEAVNHRWGRRYNKWNEIDPPKYSRTFNDMIDWRAFFAEELAQELHMRAEVVRRFDSHHAIMVHSVPGFAYINTCADEYLLAKEMDWFGNSDGSNPFAVACTIGAAKGKYVLNAEIHALGGSTMSPPGIPSFDEIKRQILVSFGLGIKGFLFWQYKPERLGWEAPAWGLTNLSGDVTPWLEYCVRINNALQQNADRLLCAFPTPSRIAVIRSRASEVFFWAIGDETERIHRNMVEGAFLALYEANYTVSILSETQLIEEGVSDYDVVYYPLPYYIDSRAADVLKEYVTNGGTLISEALFGGFDSNSNLHATCLPGYGFDEVFGCTVDSTTSADAFRNAYEGNWAVTESDDSVVIVDNKERRAKGYHFRQSLIANSADVIARYENGDAAVTLNHFGNGKAVFIGTCPSYMFGRFYCSESRDYIVSLIQEIAGLESHAIMKNGRRCDILYCNKHPEAVVLQWKCKNDREIRFSDPALFGKTLINPIVQNQLSVDHNGLCVIPNSLDMIDLFLVK